MEELLDYVLSHLKPNEKMEGSADSDELDYLQQLASGDQITNIAEVGFNAGLSSCAFLEASPHTQVTSFDNGEHGYVKYAKEFIDKKFPGRHRLILGDSRDTVPEFARENLGVKFDLIFIDGGHRYKVVKADLLNMRKLATASTLIVVDDLTPWFHWGIGPTRAWRKAIRKGWVTQKEVARSGKFGAGPLNLSQRSWALGRYNFDC